MEPPVNRRLGFDAVPNMIWSTQFYSFYMYSSYSHRPLVQTHCTPTSTPLPPYHSIHPTHMQEGLRTLIFDGVCDIYSV